MKPLARASAWRTRCRRGVTRSDAQVVDERQDHGRSPSKLLAHALGPVQDGAAVAARGRRRAKRPSTSGGAARHHERAEPVGPLAAHRQGCVSCRRRRQTAVPGRLDGVLRRRRAVQRLDRQGHPGRRRGSCLPTSRRVDIKKSIDESYYRLFLGLLLLLLPLLDGLAALLRAPPQ